MWSEMTASERHEAVAAMSECTNMAIARKYGTSPKSVYNIRRNVINPDHVSRDSLYAKRDKRDAAIMGLLGQGLSKREASRQLGLTSGAVAGACARMRKRGLLPPVPPKEPKEPNAPKVPRASKASGRSYGSRGATRGGLVSQTRIAQLSREASLTARENLFDPLPGTTPVPYGSRGCKWSVDGLHGRGLLWCGLPRDTRVRDNEPFCKHHASLAYQEIKPKAERMPSPPIYIRPRSCA